MANKNLKSLANNYMWYLKLLETGNWQGNKGKHSTYLRLMSLLATQSSILDVLPSSHYGGFNDFAALRIFEACTLWLSSDVICQPQDSSNCRSVEVAFQLGAMTSFSHFGPWIIRLPRCPWRCMCSWRDRRSGRRRQV